jgi:hypothetical protein
MNETLFAPLFAAPATADAPSSAAVPAAEAEQVPRLDAAPVEKASIFKRAVCVQLSLSRLGTRRKVDADTMNKSDADSDLLHVSAEILKSPELDAIKKHDRAMSELLRNRASGPALFKGGVFLLSLSLIEDTDRELLALLDERRGLVDRFVGAYLTRKTETELKLGSLAGSFEWPSLDRVRAAFDAQIRYLALDTPETLKGIKAEIFERERVKAEREWSAALDECRQVLRAAFADLVDHMAERLTAKDDGKPKIFRDSLVKNFDEFCATFAARNIADDDDLADLVRRARDVMQGVTAQDLRGQDALRQSVAAKMAAIKTAIDPLVTDRPSRAYNEDE